MSVEPSALSRAESILAGQFEPPQEVLKLVRRLHQDRRFGLARKLLDRLRQYSEVAVDPQLRLAVGQKLALSTYKDPDLPADLKLERALAILRSVEDLERTNNQESLGLAGAIHKRMWEFNGSERHLEASAAFYFRGYQKGVVADFGYTAINASFVLDLLADLEVPEEQHRPVDKGEIAVRSKQARAIRLEIVERLPNLPDTPEQAWLSGTWWFLATLGESFFGLNQYDQADVWLQRAAALRDVADWEQESTARQLAALLNLMERRAARSDESLDPRAREVLRNFLRKLSSVSNAEAALSSVVRGKVGLALSGGGFRAALYHVGVLARLAELDLLRHVEYLSCVSGGSIVGAHYYLEARKLLTSKPDAEITRQDYLDIVERIQRDLLAGVQRNIRTRIAAEWLTNIRMIFEPDYSRTKRAGELYESEIFSHVQDGEGGSPRFLNELMIIPPGELDTFRPKDHNWRRAAKVPILVLNATSLNTGHNWQFTASWMGEPPAGIDSEVDANFRLRRMYYEQAPAPHNRMRLGYAVAASACVPGIFEPLPLVNLYERLPAESDRKVRPIVRLVDGGVYDNQGISALLEQGCSVLLVSDASGQMDHEDSPSSGLFGVPLRANSILQSRVRVSQYEDLESRRRAGTIKGLMFVHLKKDLDTSPVDWIGCQDPSEPSPIRALTSYGIQKGIQRRLAAIRTDLDSFTDVEAFSLMTSAYLATETALKNSILGFKVDQAPRSAWAFLAIAPLLEQPSALSPEAHWLDRQLRIGSQLAFKVWAISWPLRLVAGLAVVGVFVAILFAAYSTYNLVLGSFIITTGDLLWGITLLALPAPCFTLVTRILGYRKTLREVLIGTGMATVGFIFARLHLHVFDPLFRLKGSLPRAFRRTQAAAIQERTRVVQEREQILETARTSDRKPGYAVQQSEGFVLSAKKSLDPSTEAKVTRAIFELSDYPHTNAAHPDTQTGLKLLAVAGTNWQIAYDVDDERRRVRIHHLVNVEMRESARR
jgi:predicted acylesterase/phospholipase RssA